MVWVSFRWLVVAGVRVDWFFGVGILFLCVDGWVMHRDFRIWKSFSPVLFLLQSVRGSDFEFQLECDVPKVDVAMMMTRLININQDGM